MVTYRRTRLFADDAALRLLGRFIRECRRQWPFNIDALVLLPDHLHAMWTLPPGDDNYSARWSWIKKEFTAAWLEQGGTERAVSDAEKREHRRGVWQPRFWEHTLETEEDFERHFDYTDYNPVKHGHARCPGDWSWSSFHRWVRRGVYPIDWACSDRSPPSDFSDLDDTVGE